MFRTEAGKDRGQLGFKDAVLCNFQFLHAYGLKPVEEDATIVRYKSDTVFVNIYHGRASFEIGVEIGRLDRPEKYGLDYIVSLAGKQASKAEGFDRGTIFQVSSREGVLSIVPKVARLVKTYGDPFLSGRPDFYAGLQRANERASVVFEREQILARIRKEADGAWMAKDFDRVTELLQPVRNDLTEVEGRRLAYSEKHGTSRGSDAGKPTEHVNTMRDK